MKILFLFIFIQYLIATITCRIIDYFQKFHKIRYNLDKIQRTSDNYNFLRTQPCHFCTRNPGFFNPKIDQYGGEMHKSMILLQKYLGRKGTKQKNIQELMGNPDQKLNLDENVRWIYYWRGKRDYVYFDIKIMDGTVINSGWYHVYV